MSKRKTPQSPIVQKQVIQEVKEKSEDITSWYEAIFDIKKINKKELNDMYDIIKYKGFDREQSLRLLKELVGDNTRLFSEIVMVCAVRGPQQAAVTVLSNGSRLLDMGVPASGVKGTNGISCNRIGAATADIAAYLMKQINVQKRIEDHPLPGWLQFPQAGSIKLPKQYRQWHEDFHRKFSVIIGGVFNEQIYKIMVTNSYLRPDLNLFE